MALKKLYLGVPILRTKRRDGKIMVCLPNDAANATPGHNRWISVSVDDYNKNRTYYFTSKKELKNAKIFEMTSREYTSGDVETNPIQNFQDMRWPLTSQERSDLYRDNREAFKHIFGSPIFYFRSEFNFHCYPIELPEAQILLLTAKGKGTSYEVIVKKDGKKVQKDKKAILTFLQDLESELNDWYESESRTKEINKENICDRINN